jgi:hypothetical protein
MERINVRVESRLKRRLEDEAKSRGVRPSDIVREALEGHLGAHAPGRGCLDLARQIGLIGYTDGLPPDLSTNRDHLEGFGCD